MYCPCQCGPFILIDRGIRDTVHISIQGHPESPYDRESPRVWHVTGAGGDYIPGESRNVCSTGFANLDATTSDQSDAVFHRQSVLDHRGARACHHAKYLVSDCYVSAQSDATSHCQSVQGHR